MSALLESIAFNASVIKPWWANTEVERAANVRRFQNDIPSDEIAKAAGLDWRLLKTRVQFEGLIPEDFKLTEDYSSWVRSDTGTLVALNGPAYHAFQNEDLIRLCDALTREGKGSYLVAGVLDRGRKVWAQLDAGQFEITNLSGRRLAVKRTLFAYNSHDGSGRVIIKYATTFVVCFNTAQIAAAEGGASYKRKHTASIANFDDVQAGAREALGIGGESWDSQQAILQALAVKPMGEKVAREFFAALLTETTSAEDARKAALDLKDEGGRSYTIFAKKGARLVENFRSGLGNSGESFLDALQAVTQAVDHAEFRTDEWRAKNPIGAVDSALFGSGEKLKEQAVTLLQKWAA